MHSPVGHCEFRSKGNLPNHLPGGPESAYHPVRPHLNEYVYPLDAVPLSSALPEFLNMGQRHHLCKIPEPHPE